MSRKHILWLAIAADARGDRCRSGDLDIAGSRRRFIAAGRHPHRRTRCRRARRHRGDARTDSRPRLPPRRVRRIMDRRHHAPLAATTAATPATTSSTAICSTRRTWRSSGAPTLLPPAPCATRTPMPSCVHARQPDRRRRADRPPRAAGAGLGPGCAELDRRDAGSVRQRSGQSACGAGPGQPGQGRREPAVWMPPNHAFRCQYSVQFIAVLRGYGLPVDAPSAPVLREAAQTCPTG